MGIPFQNKMSFTERFMSGGKATVHVDSLSSEFSQRRLVGWMLLIAAIGVQIGVAIWMSSDLRKLQNDITSVSSYIIRNRTLNPTLGQSSCTLDQAFSSAAAPPLVTSTATRTVQIKILLLVLASTLAVFGVISLSPNPFKLPPKPSTVVSLPVPI
jgi:hypothetical protein